jgi:hypothetical protein
MASTLTEYLDSQQELEKEAALALPYSFSHCTYSRGPISARLSTFVSPVPRDAASAPPALSPVTRTTNNSSYFQSANFVVTAQPVPLPIRVRFINILKLRTRKTSMAKTLMGNSVAVEGRTMQSRSGRL